MSWVSDPVEVYIDRTCFNPLTPVSDQERISPYIINTIASRQVMRIKRNSNQLIQWQILKTKIIKIVQQSAKRITNGNEKVKQHWL